jgi:Family of unknown function (DUF6084)
MPDLNFNVEKAEPISFAVAPLLAFKLRVNQEATLEAPLQIHSVALRCQIRIEPAQRHYGNGEREHLIDLFDKPDRWSRTLKPLLWTHTNVTVPAFTDSIVVDLPVPCTYDFNLAATKYFYALEDGEIPLSLLFSGSIFYEVEDTGLQVVQIPWEKEARFRLPVQIWKGMMELYYPNTAWLCLRKDIFERLYQFKISHGLPTWEEALEHLLPVAKEQALI